MAACPTSTSARVSTLTSAHPLLVHALRLCFPAAHVSVVPMSLTPPRSRAGTSQPNSRTSTEPMAMAPASQRPRWSTSTASLSMLRLQRSSPGLRAHDLQRAVSTSISTAILPSPARESHHRAIPLAGRAASSAPGGILPSAVLPQRDSRNPPTTARRITSRVRENLEFLSEREERSVYRQERRATQPLQLRKRSRPTGSLPPSSGERRLECGSGVCAPLVEVELEDLVHPLVD